MKLTLLFLLFCSLPSLLFAQKVKVEDNKIFVDDVPYAILKKTGTITHTYSLRTLDDNEVAVIVYDDNTSLASPRYICTFLGSGKTAAISADLNFTKKLAKEFVSNEIIKDGKYNPAGERRFILIHPDRPLNNTPPPPADPGPGAVSNAQINTAPSPGTVVERDRSMPITLLGEQIQQANTLIGSYKMNKVTSDGDILEVYSFYLPGGQKVAEATIPTFDSKECKIVTIKDNTIRRVNLKGDFDYERAKEIAEYLSSHFYL